MFDKKSSLCFRNLCKNRINSIDINAFDGLVSLERLVLCRNKLKDLRNFTHMCAKDCSCKLFQNLHYL